MRIFRILEQYSSFFNPKQVGMTKSLRLQYVPPPSIGTASRISTRPSTSRLTVPAIPDVRYWIQLMPAVSLQEYPGSTEYEGEFSNGIVTGQYSAADGAKSGRISTRIPNRRADGGRGRSGAGKWPRPSGLCRGSSCAGIAGAAQAEHGGGCNIASSW